MDIPRPTRALARPGVYLLVAGGATCLLGYFAPWITFHAEGGYLNVTLTGWQAGPGDVLGHGGYFVPGGSWAPIQAVVGVILVAFVLFPLCMGALALLAGLRPSSLPSPSRAPRLFWSVTLLGALALAYMTSALDPIGLDPASMWVLAHDPAPSIQPGLVMMCAGTLAIILGGLLSGRRPAPSYTPSAAHPAV